MADERELIVLDVDERPAVAGTDRANAALAEYEQRAKRANQNASGEFQKAGETIVRVSDRSRNSIERMVAAAEKKAATVGLSGADRLVAERDQVIKRLAGEEDAIRRVTAAYGKLAEAQQTRPQSLTQQIVEAHILLDITQKTVDLIKEATVGATLYAARTEQLGVALQAVAKANQVSAGTAATLEHQIEKLGVTTQDSREALSRLIAAHVDYTKAAKLAAAAQDVGRISGEGTAASFQRLVHAIISAQPEMLRQVGLNLSFEDSYKRAAKALNQTVESLTESQKLQIRTNDVLRVAANYNGVYAASLDTVGGRLLSLERKVNEARNAIGERFQTEASATLKVLEGLADLATRFPDAFVKGGAAIVSAMGGVALAIGAISGGPVIAGIGAVTAVIGALALGAKKLSEDWGELKRVWDAATFDDLGFRKAAEAQAKAVAYAKFQEASLRDRTKAEEVAAAQSGNLAKREQKEKEDAEKAKEAAIRKRAEAEKHTNELLLSAQANEHNGLFRILGERRKLLEIHGLTAKAIENINRVTQINLNKELEKIQLENRKALKGQIDDDKQYEDRRSETRNKRYQDQIEFTRDTLKIQNDATASQLDYEEQIAQQHRDTEFRKLEGFNARTTEQKIAVERQKAKIEEQFIVERTSVLAAALEREVAQETAAAEAIARVRGYSEEQIQERRNAINEKFQEQFRQLERNSIAEIAQTREDAANRSAQIMLDANQQAFDKTRDAFESLLDQMLGRTKSWGDVMKSIFMTTILTPLKQMASAWFAALATGQQVVMGPGGKATVVGGGANALTSGAGVLGSLFGLGGRGGFSGNPASMLGPGGTAGFAGPVGMSGVAGVSGQGGFGIGSVTGFGAYGKGILGQMRALGNLGRARDILGNTPGSIPGTPGANAPGVQGLGGGAMLIGGGILAADGLRRGGFVGLGEATAGGALIGAKFGGPIGALSGGGIGAVAGLVRLFIKGAEDKAVEKIKALYGLTQVDKSFAKQIVAMAKQGFAGNLDVAIRAPQVRDLIELYAMSTGQKFGGPSSMPRGVSLVQAGGALYQSPSYQNGVELPSLGGSVPSVSVAAPQAQGASIFQFDAEATKQVLAGNAAEAIKQQPRLVAQATERNTKASLGRRESAAATLGVPGLITG